MSEYKEEDLLEVNSESERPQNDQDILGRHAFIDIIPKNKAMTSPIYCIEGRASANDILDRNTIPENKDEVSSPNRFPETSTEQDSIENTLNDPRPIPVHVEACSPESHFQPLPRISQALNSSKNSEDATGIVILKKTPFYSHEEV